MAISERVRENTKKEWKKLVYNEEISNATHQTTR